MPLQMAEQNSQGGGVTDTASISNPGSHAFLIRLPNPMLIAVPTQSGSHNEQSIAQFASTDCPFRMSGVGSSVEAVWGLG